MARKQRSLGSDVDMTPMIDVVFQLIIFFIVTIKLDQEVNENIRLWKAEHGPPIEEQQPGTTIIEVDQHGWISMHGAQLTKSQLLNILKTKRDRRGSDFPVIIRGDHRARHKDIRSVMDMCTRIGIWRISFMAIKEEKQRRRWQ
jgi:biopolymer transport protein ExbD